MEDEHDTQLDWEEQQAVLDANARAHARVEHNLTNHPPVSGLVVECFEAIRLRGKALAHTIIDLCPGGTDRDLALAAVEDAVHRAVAAIARDQGAVMRNLAGHSDLDGVLDNTVSFDAPTGEPSPTVAIEPNPEGTPFRNGADLEEKAADALGPRQHAAEGADLS